MTKDSQQIRFPFDSPQGDKSASPDAGFVTLARPDAIPQGCGRSFRVGNKDIALFNVQGHFYALDNACPHQGGPLAEGILEGTIVECPWHGWKFDVTNGRSFFNPKVPLPPYEVRVVNGEVRVKCK